ncbi:MAG TPA: response regulator transcription factor [Gemmatimonadales bacterium]|nr:response regulator transcription factor [Gemmatimonadales bacterium]
MTETRVRVMLVDDHTLVREGIRHVLTATPGVEVVAEAGDAPEALRLAAESRPDIVVQDLSLPGASGLDLTTRLKELLPSVKVMILSVHDHPEYVLGAVRAGAQGYLRKDTSPAELRSALQAVARGESYFSPPVARHLTAAVRGENLPEDPAGRLARLTPREREVLAGIAAGETSRAIAGRLGLSPRTVETYRESLARKLDIKTVAALTRFALEAGLVRTQGDA